MLSSEEQKTQESYKKIAGVRNKTHGSSDFWRLEFNQLCRMVPRGKFLDAGCGGGRDAILFTEAGYGYVGCDLSPEMLAEARLLVPTADFRSMDLYNIDFPEASFDGFWASASLLHIPKAKIPLVLAQLRKILKPDGVGFITLKEGEGEKMVKGPIEGDDRFFSFYDIKEFSGILVDNGFEVVTSSKRSTGNTTWLVFFVRIKR